MVTFLTDPPRRLYDYWLSLPKIGLLPPRSAVNPADIKDLLPLIAITEWKAPGELEYRLAGTGVVERLGFDPTGRNFLELIDPDEKAEAVKGLGQILATPCGARSVRREDYQHGFQRLVEHVALPLDGESSGRSLLITATGLLDRSMAWIDTGPLFRMERPGEVEYIDIGAGIVGPRDG